MCILRIFRKRRLKKDAGKTVSGFVPLDRIRSLAVIMDVSGKGFDECRKEILRFCKARKIELTLFYLDFEGKAVTDEEDTVFRKDLGLTGIPSAGKVGTLLGKCFDCLICLSDSRKFCVEYLSKAVEALQKIGIRELPDSPYGVVVAPGDKEGSSGVSQKDLFLYIVSIIGKIR